MVDQYKIKTRLNSEDEYRFWSVIERYGDIQGVFSTRAFPFGDVFINKLFWFPDGNKQSEACVSVEIECMSLVSSCMIEHSVPLGCDFFDAIVRDIVLKEDIQSLAKLIIRRCGSDVCLINGVVSLWEQCPDLRKYARYVIANRANAFEAYIYTAAMLCIPHLSENDYSVCTQAVRSFFARLDVVETAARVLLQHPQGIFFDFLCDEMTTSLLFRRNRIERREVIYSTLFGASPEILRANWRHLIEYATEWRLCFGGKELIRLFFQIPFQDNVERKEARALFLRSLDYTVLHNPMLREELFQGLDRHFCFITNNRPKVSMA